MPTFGLLPSDVVTNSRGDVVGGVTLSLYETHADATAATGLLAAVTTDLSGQWTYTHATLSVVWVRTPAYEGHPSGSVYAVISPEAVTGMTDANNILTGTVADARLPVSARAATLTSTFVPQTGSANSGISARKITREIADPNRTASKWREVFNAGSFNTHADPQHFFGWNADKPAGGGDPAEPSIYMGFEADYWDTSSTRTMEWYVGVVRADGSPPAFRPFAVTAARDSNADLAASVQIDIGNNANGSARSRFDVMSAGGALFTVYPDRVFLPSIPIQQNTNAVDWLMQANHTGGAYLSIAHVDVADNVVLGQPGSPVSVAGNVLGLANGSYATAMSFVTLSATMGNISNNGKGNASTSGIYTQNVSGTNYHALGVNTTGNSGAVNVVPSDATLRGVVITGRAGQSANLFEAQDSASAIKASVSAAGALFTAGGAGFNGTTPIAKRATTADSTDLASVITLANALKADLIAYGLKS